MTDKKNLMKIAIDLAKENLQSNNGGPFGAIVVKDGKIVGKGVNTVTTKNDPTAHAEVNAIRDACKNLNSFQLEGCDIYSSCEPCPMCLGAIYWSRPKSLYFAASKEDAEKAGFDDSIIYKEINLPVNLRKIPTTQILRDKAEEVFISWIKMENKSEY